MKSTTIRRSNLSKEKMAVLEALKKYRNEESDYAPNVYIRPVSTESAKQEELDLLWKSFNIDFSSQEKTPKFYVASGIVAGVLLVGALAMTVFFAHNMHNPNIASEKSSIGLIPSSANEEISNSSETYIVQNGDTIEKILIRFYGQYSKQMEANIMQANNMANPNKLSIGQELIIPMN